VWRTHVIGRNRGFTLVETLAVLIILGLLAGVLIPAAGMGMVKANQMACASNMKQIGTAILLYANDNDGALPPTTHTTGSLGAGGRYESWIYQLAPYLADVNKVRVCPSDKQERKDRILKEPGLTSYVLNDLVFDPEDDAGRYNNLKRIKRPAETLIMFVVSDDRPVNRGWDHAHCGEWTSWFAVLADIEPDRHRWGDRAEDRMKGSSNYLYADGHVENISARDFKAKFEGGKNPAEVPR
jgi:prepilin-type N-terminal cleavage/methylation domain-containing protein/prepilin-type processing-associated H-X9-DG protein